jgi:hypothetical protein
LKRWVVAALAVVVSVAALVPLLATARHAALRDANDTKGVLDIRRVEMTKGARWKVTSWIRWKTEDVWDRGFTFVYLDTFGGSRADYYVLVSSNGRKLTGVLHRDPPRGDDRRIRTVRTRHPNGKVVNVAVPLNRLRRRDGGVFRWYVLTMISGDNCRRFCFDRAPDSGTVAEPGPRPTPTVPTPTVTPTLTPTPTASP